VNHEFREGRIRVPSHKFLPVKRLILGGELMGANPTQAGGILLTFIAFVFVASAFAGGGVIAAVIGLVVLGAACALFLKCKPWEHKAE
jgi:hypothetical protein